MVVVGLSELPMGEGGKTPDQPAAGTGLVVKKLMRAQCRHTPVTDRNPVFAWIGRGEKERQNNHHQSEDQLSYLM